MIDPIEAERIVLGAVMASDGETLADTSLTADEFSRVPHRELWTLLAAMTTAGQPVHPVAVKDRLAQSPIVGIDGPYLHTLYASVPTTANAEFYAAIVREHADLRSIGAAGQRMMQATTIGDAENAKAHARQTLDALDLRDAGGTSSRVGDLLMPTMHAIELGQSPGLSTPWHDLDSRLGGLRPGTSTVIAARPGLGKSIVGLQIAAHVAQKHGLALLHSLEMPSGELMRRLLSSTSGVDFSSLNGKPNDMEWRRLSKVMGDLSAMPLAVDDRATVTVTEIAANARRHARDGLKLLVIDYLQLLTPTDRRAPRQEQVAEQSRSLKLLAKDLGIAVVVLAQLNRASENRADKHATLADLRESGAIEQDADAVLLLYRDADTKDESVKRTLEVGVAKNRGGPTGRVDLYWDAAHMRVSSSARWAS